MLQNPFLPAPSQAKAWAEGFTKGFVSNSSPEPGEDVGPDDVDAFNQGVAAGLDSVNDGLDLDNPCVPALEEEGPGHSVGMAINAAEIAHGVWEARHLATLAGGLAGILLAFVELACTLPVHVLPPSQVLPPLLQSLIDMLASYGFDSVELFCGAGLDATAAGCEIRLTPLFISLDQARQAAIDMNRPQWIVVSWRTDQSNSFKVVDSQ